MSPWDVNELLNFKNRFTSGKPNSATHSQRWWWATFIIAPMAPVFGLKNNFKIEIEFWAARFWFSALDFRFECGKHICIRRTVLCGGTFWRHVFQNRIKMYLIDFSFEFRPMFYSFETKFRTRANEDFLPAEGFLKSTSLVFIFINE